MNLEDILELYHIQPANTLKPHGQALAAQACARGEHEMAKVTYVGDGRTATTTDCIWCAYKYRIWAAQQRRGGRSG